MQITQKRVIGRKPKPRALVLGFNADTTKRLAAIFPTVREISSIDEVRQEESDVLVTIDKIWDVRSWLFVVGVGCQGTVSTSDKTRTQWDFGTFHIPGLEREPSPPRPRSRIVWKRESKATEFQIPDDLPVAIQRLVETELIPLAQYQKSHLWLGSSDVKDEQDPNWLKIFQPFLLTADGKPLAGKFLRPGGKTECWCFPTYAIAATPLFVEAALMEWAKLDPSTFPLADWVNDSQWRTPTENRIAGDLERLQNERRAILIQLDEREDQLEAELLEAKRSAEARERLLLTAQGDDLVSTAAECFSNLGFGVTNMDDVYPAGDRLEDLQLTAPEEPGWTALVEVRGYKKGAQINDLLRFSRFRSRFVSRNGREPSAQWYVVNQFLEDNPATRRAALQGADVELATFGADGGLVIDTTDLFDLWMSVQGGRLSVEDARSQLMQARGRFAVKEADR